MFPVNKIIKGTHNLLMESTQFPFLRQSQFFKQTLQAVLVRAARKDGPQVTLVNMLNFLLPSKV
jgi:hypothetical protein